jgi:hypothetical protein
LFVRALVKLAMAPLKRTLAAPVKLVPNSVTVVQAHRSLEKTVCR